jgi:hypothetical protein
MSIVPNPADDRVVMHYSVPTKGFVTLRIIDMLGRQVAVIEYDDQMAGEYIAEFSASNLPSGSFIVELLHNGGIASQTLRVLH